MTQEEKELLLKDLCARLPYGVKAFAKTHKGSKIGKVITITTKFIDYSKGNATLGELYTDDECFWLDCNLFKPYLRTMSSITEEERKELLEIAVALSYNKDDIIIGTQINSFRQLDGVLDLFNSHHLDWRGLIEKGLALEAPDGMYK